MFCQEANVEQSSSDIRNSRQGSLFMHLRRTAALVAASLVVAPASAPVHPGVMTFTDGAQCTANFVFYDASNVYIGQAAHCSGTGAATDTNGCTSESLPIGTPVDVTGASRPGKLVY